METVFCFLLVLSAAILARRMGRRWDLRQALFLQIIDFPKVFSLRIDDTSYRFVPFLVFGKHMFSLLPSFGTAILLRWRLPFAKIDMCPFVNIPKGIQLEDQRYVLSICYSFFGERRSFKL